MARIMRARITTVPIVIPAIAPGFRPEDLECDTRPAVGGDDVEETVV